MGPEQHLICCFESKKMVPFPTSDGTQGQVILCIVNVDNVKWVQTKDEGMYVASAKGYFITDV